MKGRAIVPGGGSPRKPHAAGRTTGAASRTRRPPEGARPCAKLSAHERGRASIRCSAAARCGPRPPASGCSWPRCPRRRSCGLPGRPVERVDVRGALAWQTTYFVAWIPFTIAVWHVTRGRLPERFGGWPRFLIAHAAVFAASRSPTPLVVTLLALVLANQNMPMWQSFVMQVRGRLNLQLLIYTAIIGTGAALTLHERYQDRQVAAARLQAELAAARLQALRGHLQPHFLFNSLHSIAALARAGDTAGVVRLTAGLSDLLRYVLDAGDRHASLREELQIVERYLEIQRARFADRLDVTVDVAPDVADARVPLLIVQPLVENAVRHGLAPRVREGSLVVRAVRDNGRTRIDVEDTGVGLPPGWRLRRRDRHRPSQPRVAPRRGVRRRGGARRRPARRRRRARHGDAALLAVMTRASPPRARGGPSSWTTSRWRGRRCGCCSRGEADFAIVAECGHGADGHRRDPPRAPRRAVPRRADARGRRLRGAAPPRARRRAGGHLRDRVRSLRAAGVRAARARLPAEAVLGRTVRVVLERTRARLRERTFASMAGRLSDLLSATAPERRQLVVRDGGRTVVIPHDDIVWIEAEDYCARIHLRGRTLLVRDSLRALGGLARWRRLRARAPLGDRQRRLHPRDRAAGLRRPASRAQRRTVLKISRTHRAQVVEAVGHGSSASD